MIKFTTKYTSKMIGFEYNLKEIALSVVYPKSLSHEIILFFI